MSNDFLSQQDNATFISFVLDEGNKKFYARLHRQFLAEQLLEFCRYLDLRPREVRIAYNKVLAQYWMDYKLQRLDPNFNWHLSFYNDTIYEMMEYKRQQIRNRKEMSHKNDI